MRTNVINANKARRQNLVGKQFHSLTVQSYDEAVKKWNCSCDCGGFALVPTNKLNSGNTKSCGCYQKKKASEAASQLHQKRRVSRGLSTTDYLSSESQRERATFIPTSRLVLKRDEYHCIWCSQRGGTLNAHHLKPWMDHPEARYDMSNLVTLCQTCHLAVHNGDYHKEVDPVMTILLEGYAAEVEAICARVELT